MVSPLSKMEGMRSKEMIGTRPHLQGPLSGLVVLGAVFVAALCLRLYRISEPLFDFSPVRQYHSALLARGFYEWLLTGNLKTLPPDGIIEPPILELLASLAYALSGGEHLWIPRLLSASFWMVGGVFLYLIARKIVSSNAAVFSVAFYLLAPAAVLPSRAFMPDPLMIMLLMISVYTILRYHEHPTMGRLAGRYCGLFRGAFGQARHLFVSDFRGVWCADGLQEGTYQVAYQRTLTPVQRIEPLARGPLLFVWGGDPGIPPGAGTRQVRATVFVGDLLLGGLARADRVHGRIHPPHGRGFRGPVAPPRITEGPDGGFVGRLLPLRVGLHLSYSHPRVLFLATDSRGRPLAGARMGCCRRLHRAQRSTELQTSPGPRPGRPRGCLRRSRATDYYLRHCAASRRREAFLWEVSWVRP